MSKFSNFIEQYTYPYDVLRELEAFIINNNQELIPNSGGCATLGAAIHEDVQKAIYRIIAQNSVTRDIPTMELFESAVQNELARQIENDIGRHATIDPRSKLSKEGIADYFINEIFEPLLESAKDIDKELFSARHSSRKR